ncbi:MAG: glycosyltransferase [Bacteroidota bacterium]|nr:glycosyltransferase [Bacteroidota bacterium]
MKEKNSRFHVLYLPRWYPNRYDPMPGLFIERHGLSVLRHADVSVLYVHSDDQLKEKQYDIIENNDKGMFTVRIYFQKSKIAFKPLANLVNGIRFFKSHLKGFKIIRKKVRRADLVHVHVLTRLGIIAWLNKLKHGTPYLITEHWTRYLPTTDTYHGFFRKLATRFVVKRASAVLPVTANLRDAMIDNGLKNDNYVVIPNVVDVKMFSPRENKRKDNKKQIVHLSCFADIQKNISGILRVLKRLSKKRQDFECVMVGDGVDFGMLKAYSDELELTGKFVHFHGLKENQELADIMAEADFMIMFSNHENLPVVILESYACGVPVISTRVGGIHEHMNDDLGKLTTPKDEDEFLETIEHTLDRPDQYNKEKIRKYAVDHFSNEVIGHSLFKVYSDILNQNK